MDFAVTLEIFNHLLLLSIIYHKLEVTHYLRFSPTGPNRRVKLQSLCWRLSRLSLALISTIDVTSSDSIFRLTV